MPRPNCPETMISLLQKLGLAADGHETGAATSALLSFLLDATPDWIFIKDRDHRFLLANRAFAESQGVTPVAMLGRPDTDFWSLDLCEGNAERDVIGFRHDDRLVFAGERVHNPNVQATLRSGEIRTFDGWKVPLRDASGDIVAVLAIFRDITETHQIRQTLQQREAQLQGILDFSPILISAKDLDGRVTLCNRRFDVLDLPPPEQIIGQSVFDLFAPEIAQALWSNDLAARNGPIEAEETVLHRDGKMHTYLTVKFPLRQLNGDITGTGAVSTDITERKQAEMALEGERDFIRAVLDTSPASVLVLDRRGLLVDINQAGQRLMQKTLDELRGTDVILSLVPAGEHGQIKSRLRDAFAIGGLVHYEGPVRHADGQEFFVRWQARGFVTAGGDSQYLVAVGVDVTELRREQKEREATERQLRDVLNSVELITVMLDKQGKVSYCSDGLARVTGWEKTDIIGNDWFATFLPADDVDSRGVFERGLVEQSFLPVVENRVLTRDGMQRLIRWHNTPNRNVQGEIVGITSIGEDVTDMRALEEHMRLSAKVFDSTADGIVIVDARNNIVGSNPAFTSITGFQEDELIGRHANLLKSKIHDDVFYSDIWAEVESRGFWQGEIWGCRKDGTDFPGWLTISRIVDANGRVTHHVGAISDISTIKQSETKLQYMAHYDALTGLPNRSLLMDRLDHAVIQAKRGLQQVAVVFIDLDNFKTVNDLLGHAVGDQLLVQVATTIRKDLREEDTFARLGGDEFLLVIHEADAAHAARVIGEKLLEVFRHPFTVGEHMLFVTASMGVSVYPFDGLDSAVLIRHADLAMYQAKGLGRNAFCFYSPEMSEKAVAQAQMEQALRRAIDEHQLILYYQPQVDLQSGVLVGAEALLRWQHPVHGIITPGDFIPLAEDTGIITPLGEWVLREASRQLAAWRASGYNLKNLAVNMSVRQVERSDMASLVCRVLEEAGLPPSCLTIEITESVVVKSEQSLGMLKVLQEVGVQLAIDDFGTGYSSLSYLKQLPIQKLKIDKSFIQDIAQDPNDEAITRAIIGLAKGLGIRVIAEGVETEEQLAFLRREGCLEGQGYLFGYPLPAKDFENQWLS